MEGWRRTAKRGNYRDFSVPIPVVCAPGGLKVQFRRRRPVIGIPDMQQRVGSHRLPAAGIAGDGGRGHSRKALFNQVIIRQKDIFRPASAQGKVVCRPAANPGQGLQLTQPGVNIRRRRQGQLAAERRPGEVDQRLRAAAASPAPSAPADRHGQRLWRREQDISRRLRQRFAPASRHFGGEPGGHRHAHQLAQHRAHRLLEGIQSPRQAQSRPRLRLSRPACERPAAGRRLNQTAGQFAHSRSPPPGCSPGERVTRRPCASSSGAR